MAAKGKHLRSPWLACLVALLAIPALGAAKPPEIKVLSTSHFLVYYLASDHAVAQQVAQLAHESLAGISRDLGFTPSQKMTILVYADRKQFLQATRTRGRDIVLGTATPSQDLIQIDASGLLGSLAILVAHEVSHLVLAQLLGENRAKCPRWLDEGIAQYESRDWGPIRKKQMAEVLASGSALPLSELDRAFRHSKELSDIAYLQSASLVYYLVEEKGERVLANLLAALKEEPDLDAALVKAAGINTGQWERGWRRSLRAGWRWGMLLESPLLPFLIMAILCLVGFALFLKRRRERWKEWEEEQESELPTSES